MGILNTRRENITLLYLHNRLIRWVITYAHEWNGPCTYGLLYLIKVVVEMKVSRACSSVQQRGDVMSPCNPKIPQSHRDHFQVRIDSHDREARFRTS